MVSCLSGFHQLHIVYDAADGSELLARLNNEDVAPAICLLDISMRPMNGYDTLAALNVKWPDVRCLMLSQYYDEWQTPWIRQGGGRGYLPKNCDVAELVQAIEIIHHGNLYFKHDGGDVHNPTNRKRVSSGNLTPRITDRERQFLELCSEGLKNREIATRLYISEKTAENYQHSLFRKLQVSTRTALVQRARQCGLL